MGILDGDTPITRAKSSGNMQDQGGYNEMMAKKYGQRINLFTMGKRRILVDKFYEEYFGTLNDEVEHFSKQFDKYFKMVQEEIKRVRKKDEGGIFRMIHDLAPQFFDFKIWKKITGQARKPEIAALHQIRDMIYELLPDQKKQDKFIQDPKDLLGMAFHMFGAFRKKYDKEHDTKKDPSKKGVDKAVSEIKKVAKTIFAFGKESMGEWKKDYENQRDSLEKQFIKPISEVVKENETQGGEGKPTTENYLDSIASSVSQTENDVRFLTEFISKQNRKIQEQANKPIVTAVEKVVTAQEDSGAKADKLRKEEVKTRRFLEFKEKAKKMGKGGFKLSMAALLIMFSLATAALGAVIGGLLFGKKGIVAGALIGVFIPFLIKLVGSLLVAGISKIVTTAATSIATAASTAFTKTIKPGFLDIFKSIKQTLSTAGKSIVNNVKTLFKGGWRSIFSNAMKLGKFAKVGGIIGAIVGFLEDIVNSLDFFKQGKIGEGIMTIFMGKEGKTTKEKISNTMMQALKWGMVGLAIGGPIGLGVGLIAGVLLGMYRNKLFAPYWRLMKSETKGKTKGAKVGNVGKGMAAWYPFMMMAPMSIPFVLAYLSLKQGIHKLIMKGLSNVFGGLRNASKAVGGFFLGLWDKILGKGKDLLARGKAAFFSFFDSIKNIGAKIGEFLFGGKTFSFAGIGKKIKDAILIGIENLKQGGINIWQGILGIGTNIKNVFFNAIKWIADIPGKLWLMIKSVVGTIKSLALSMLRNAKDMLAGTYIGHVYGGNISNEEEMKKNIRDVIQKFQTGNMSLAEAMGKAKTLIAAHGGTVDEAELIDEMMREKKYRGNEEILTDLRRAGYGTEVLGEIGKDEHLGALQGEVPGESGMYRARGGLLSRIAELTEKNNELLAGKVKKVADAEAEKLRLERENAGHLASIDRKTPEEQEENNFRVFMGEGAGEETIFQMGGFPKEKTVKK